MDKMDNLIISITHDQMPIEYGEYILLPDQEVWMETDPGFERREKIGSPGRFPGFSQKGMRGNLLYIIKGPEHSYLASCGFPCAGQIVLRGLANVC